VILDPTVTVPELAETEALAAKLGLVGKNTNPNANTATNMTGITWLIRRNTSTHIMLMLYILT
jgi:hypothetical protein